MKTPSSLNGWKTLAAALLMVMITGCASRYSAGLTGYLGEKNDPCALWIKARGVSSFKSYTGQNIPELVVEEKIKLEPWMFRIRIRPVTFSPVTEYFSLQEESTPGIEEWMLTPGKAFCCIPDNLLVARTPVTIRPE